MQSHRHRPIASSPCPWLVRRPNECAFTIDGEGWAVLSCGNPCAQASAYCPGHRRDLKGPKALSLEELEAQLREWGI
jgi:hypothetical protein